MVSVPLLLIGGFVLSFSTFSGYRAVTGLPVFRSLSSIDADGASELVDSAPDLVDGEPAAIEGELVVEEPVDAWPSTADCADAAVGAYVWRARFPDNTNRSITVESYGWEGQKWHTFASGIEWGRFGVDVGGETVLLEPDYLRATYDCEPLDELTVGATTWSKRFSTLVWDSWYLDLRNETCHLGLGHFGGTVERYDDRVDLDRHLIELKPLAAGSTVSVRGEARVDGDEHVLRGTEAVPLTISDRGFDAHRRWIGKRAARKGAWASLLALVGVGLWTGFVLPLIALFAGGAVFTLYHLVRDLFDWLSG